MRLMTVVSAAAMLVLLAACGGGDDAGGTSPPPPPPATGIGAAGGTVTDASGAKVVVPAGALSANTAIAVAQSAAGAPAMPAGVKAVGQIFAFTPHGTTFTKPATITVPFDPATVPAGSTPLLYKTNAAQTAWEEVPGATVSGNTLQGDVSGFSYAVVLISEVQKSWTVDLYNKTTGNFERVSDGSTRAVVDEDELIGHADADTWSVFSNEAAGTFWTQAVAPLDDPDFIGVRSALNLTYYFRADQDAPTLNFLITHARIEATDYGGALPSQRICPWLSENPSPEALQEQCNSHMTDASLSVRVIAVGIGNPALFHRQGSELELSGKSGDWRPLLHGDLTEHDLFRGADFTFDADADANGEGRHFIASLSKPKNVNVPVGVLHKGDVFSVEIAISTKAINRIQGESFVGALLRDPLKDVGIDLQAQGLTQIPSQTGTPATAPVLTCSTGVDPAAGILSFGAPSFGAAESDDRASILIARTGGTAGEISVHIDTVDGSAVSGSDFESTSADVRFADGESGPRSVEVPLLNDGIYEDNEIVGLVLSAVGGCTELTAQPTARLTILDDDKPLPPPGSFTVGGTITGLTGTGLVLQERSSGQSLDVSGNAFTFPNPLADDTNYSVVVTTQPTGPVQSCTIANDSGNVSGAAVTNVEVICVTAQPSGSLDITFGDGGRVTSGVPFTPSLSDGRIGMALQPDGKILMVGGRRLVRFNVDGTLDTTFGKAGVVDVVLGGTADSAMDVAVQTDGRIVVAGSNATGFIGSDDFALTRYNADGTLDATFGVGGLVVTDFFGSTDRARRIRLQSDGRIIAVGFATETLAPFTYATRFAIARYNPDGSLDKDFSGDGMATDTPWGGYAEVNGVAIQPDSKIVIAGNVANNGVDDPDTGFVRYNGDDQSQPGTLDFFFGPTSNGLVHAPVDDYDRAVDVIVGYKNEIFAATTVDVGLTSGGRAMGFALVHVPETGVPVPLVAQPVTTFTTESDVPSSMLKQDDDKIVVVGQAASMGANPDFAIARYEKDGLSLDPTFGNGGKLMLDFFGGRDYAFAAVQRIDGKLLIGGYARKGTQNVFSLVRLAQ